MTTFDTGFTERKMCISADESKTCEQNGPYNLSLPVSANVIEAGKKHKLLPVTTYLIYMICFLQFYQLNTYPKVNSFEGECERNKVNVSDSLKIYNCSQSQLDRFK